MLAYVSYCISDFELVRPLLLHLGALGYSVHFEQKMPAARMRWKDVLASIRACDVFLLALTENALHSESRTVEYDYAIRMGKPVLCVLLTETKSPVPAGYMNLLDYRSGRGRSNTELMQTLKNLPRRKALPENVVIPDWLAPLSRVQTLITVPHPNIADQDTIIVNVREALERQETALAAELLLELFASRDDIDPKIQPQVQQISRQIRQSYTRQKRTWWRNVAFVGVFVAAIMVVSIFFVSRRLANAAIAAIPLAEITQEADDEVLTGDLTEAAPGADETLVTGEVTTATVTPPTALPEATAESG